VTAHNEERNIRKLLRSLLGQKVEPHVLGEVVVVASGCTDGTTAEVEELAKVDTRLRLIVQDTRLGKASAINAYGRERDQTSCLIVWPARRMWAWWVPVRCPPTRAVT
jgi:glycosyltransferase involved in cell wall biosynthesis